MIRPEIVEPVNLGIGEGNHYWLKNFKEQNIFSEMRDAYRFAAAYAISKGIEPKEISDKKETVFSLATIDPEREIYFLISAMYPNTDIPRYQILERFADAGMSELVKLHKDGQLNLTRLVEEIGGS